MRQWKIIGLLLLVVAVLAGCSASQTTTRPPQAAPSAPTAREATGGAGASLVVEPPVVDAGRVPYNQRVAAAWTLKNVGVTPVQIRDFELDVVSGC